MKMPQALGVVLGVILSGLILVVDLLAASGISSTYDDLAHVIGGVPYVAVVLTTLWLPGRVYTLIFAILTSVLTLMVLFFKAGVTPDAPWLQIVYDPVILSFEPGSPVTIRAFSVFAIWITAIIAIQRKSSGEHALQLSAIVESSNDAIIGKSLDGFVTSWNQGAARLYQYDAKYAIGRHISFLWPKGSSGEAEREYLKRVQEGRQVEPFETLRRKEDGTLVNVSITFSPRLDESDTIVGMAEIGRDITDRKKFEQALIEAKENAERMSRLKSSFLTNMSHEIRTPLSGILGFASILAQDADPEQYELTQLIEKSGRRLLDTINSVLDLSMLESDSFTLHPKAVDLSVEVREKVALLQPLAQSSDLQLEAVVPDEQCVAQIDTACLDRIMNNLVGNAIKFTPDGGVTVRVYRDKQHIAIEVSDTGIGISHDFMGRLFHEFEQESSGMARLYEGSGLGLSITKRLVELMDGTIEVDSDQGQGSRFTVHFPVSSEPVEEPTRIRRKRAPNRTPRRSGEAKVLVVDDDPKMRTLLKLMLGSSCKLDMAENETRAIDLAKNVKYDLILQDVNLGGKRTGVDVLREYRKLPQYDKIPVVALTAYALPRDRQMLLDAGFDDYLSKPISEDELFEVLRLVLPEEISATSIITQ